MNSQLSKWAERKCWFSTNGCLNGSKEGGGRWHTAAKRWSILLTGCRIMNELTCSHYILRNSDTKPIFKQHELKWEKGNECWPFVEPCDACCLTMQYNYRQRQKSASKWLCMLNWITEATVTPSGWERDRQIIILHIHSFKSPIINYSFIVYAGRVKSQVSVNHSTLSFA